MSAVLERSAPACTTDISKNVGKSVATIEQFLLQHPPGEPILAIGSGSYRVNFHSVICSDCGGENLHRHYCVKTLAMAESSDRLDHAQQRAQFGAMDGIALAKEFIASPLWITTGERGQFIGLGTLHLPFPKWVSQCNAIVARRIEDLACDGKQFPPVAAVVRGNDSSGRKCLRALCRHCNAALSMSPGCGPIRFSFTLHDLDGEKAMLPWLILAGNLSNVVLTVQAP